MAKDYSQMNKEELISELERLRSRKTYGLVWEDKPEDVVAQCETQVPILNEVSEWAMKTTDSKSVVSVLSALRTRRASVTPSGGVAGC